MKSVYKSLRRAVLILVVLVTLTALVLGSLGLWIWWQLPSQDEIRGCLTTKMNSVYLCPGSRDYVPLKQVAPYFVQALLLSEDSSFYRHRGFDLFELKQSLQKNISEGRFARGGSTISQQLAKNLFLSKDKTLRRKFWEALITYRIENTLSKNQILERYVNVVEFGPNIYGIKAAANYYFSKAPSELTLTESAFLVFLLPNPRVYAKSFILRKLTPFARSRLEAILNRMLAFQRIDEFVHEEALLELDYFLTGETYLSEEDAAALDEESASSDEGEISF